MNKLLLVFFIATAAIGCKSEPDRKLVLLDSIKKEYAGKEIKITSTKNAAGVEPLTTKYAYTDRKGGDLAFELDANERYKVAREEGFTFVPTKEHSAPEQPEMIFIENLREDKRGFVSYKFISEFRDVSYYDTD